MSIKVLLLNGCMLALAALLVGGCGGRNRNLKIKSKNLTGTWRYDSFANSSNAVTDFRSHTYYMRLNEEGTYVVEEYVPNSLYQYDSGKWSVQGDSLLTVSENIDATEVPIATIDRVKKDKLMLHYGDGYEYWGTATLSRAISIDRFELSRSMLEGDWEISWITTVNANGSETKRPLKGTLNMNDDGSAALDMNGEKSTGSWSINKDNTLTCFGHSIRLLMLTTNSCIFKVTTAEHTHFYCFSRYSNPNKE